MENQKLNLIDLKNKAKSVRFYGQKLKYLRKRYGLNQCEMADLLGVSQGNLSSVESGKTVPSFLIIAKICKMFDFEQDYFLKKNVNFYKN